MRLCKLVFRLSAQVMLEQGLKLGYRLRHAIHNCLTIDT
jgi:hypothetical protein